MAGAFLSVSRLSLLRCSRQGDPRVLPYKPQHFFFPPHTPPGLCQRSRKDTELSSSSHGFSYGAASGLEFASRVDGNRALKKPGCGFSETTLAAPRLLWCSSGFDFLIVFALCSSLYALCCLTFGLHFIFLLCYRKHLISKSQSTFLERVSG